MELVRKFGLIILLLFNLFSLSAQDDWMEKMKKKRWVLETATVERTDTAVRPQAYFILGDSNRLTGSSGCNNFFGTYEFRGEALSVELLGSTLMACPPGIDDRPLLFILQGAERFSLEGGKLLAWRGGNIMATFVSEQKQNEMEIFKDIQWELLSLNGEAVTAEGPGAKRPFIQFPSDPENAVYGNAGCNNFRGKAERDGNKLSFGMMAGTKMACPQLDLENRFFKMLETVDSYVLEENRLILKSGEDEVAVFEAGSKE